MNGDPLEPKFDRCAIGARDPEYASLLPGYGATWKLKSEHGSIDGMFVIEDELHAEWQGEFTALSEALAELKARADIAWDMAPNVAPCTNWKSCGRAYEIIEYDSSTKPWKEVRRFAALNVSVSGTVWNDELPAGLQ